MAITVTSSGGNSIVAAVNGGTSVSLSQLLQSVSVSTDQSVPVVVANTLGPQGVKGADGTNGADGADGVSPTASNVAATGAVMKTATSTADFDFVIDEDSFSSNSSTKVPTQQSVRALVIAEASARAQGDGINTNAINLVNGQVSLLRARLGAGITGDDLSDIGTTASDDKVLIQDTSDSNNLKYVDFGDFASGSLSNILEDTSPQLGANLDVQARSLFTSTTNGDIQFTPNGTGSVSLDGTVKFKLFASGSEPDPFEGGMYADEAHNLYFGVS